MKILEKGFSELDNYFRQQNHFVTATKWFYYGKCEHLNFKEHLNYNLRNFESSVNGK